MVAILSGGGGGGGGDGSNLVFFCSMESISEIFSEV